MKRTVSILLCLALLLSLMSLTALGAEEPEFFKVRIQTGSGQWTEQAIVEEDELYIPAENFARYTDYRFDRERNLFLIKGQELERAFKYVLIDPAAKQVNVDFYRIDLKNCYVVEGDLYLPFCQMLPILNGTIVSAGEGSICVADETMTMAHLMYDFHVNDYFFDLSREFQNEKGEGQGLLVAYWLPSYLFNSVTDFRLDRLDFFFNSGTFHDYQEIFCDYLKDDDLFEQAFELIDDPETILRIVTGINEHTEKVYDVVDWYREMEKLGKDTTSVFNEDALVEYISSGAEKLPDYGEDITDVILGVHEESNGVSFADLYELIYYAYSCYSMVEDNYKMLDAVYNVSEGLSCIDAQYRAAKEVYHLYGENVVSSMVERVGKKGLQELVKKSAAGKKLVAYELTAKAAGAVWEWVIPGDTGDISVLTLHAGVVDTARTSAGACNMHTEASVEDYRLSLLLMMLASRECYEIMAKTAEGYGALSGDYRAKIGKIEAMIQGLYLVAKNQHLDAYENFLPYARENREFLKQAGFFRNLEPVPPGQLAGPEENAYFDFLAKNPVYNYYAFLDINRDGCLELIAMEQMYGDSHDVDLYLYRDGQVVLGYEDIWGMGALSYNEDNCWIESVNSNSGSDGVWFYSLDENGDVLEQSFMESDYSGKWYCGSRVSNDAQLEAWIALRSRYDPDTSEPVAFLPVP